MFASWSFRMLRAFAASAALLSAGYAFAGAQAEKTLRQRTDFDGVRNRRPCCAKADYDVHETQAWLAEMSARLASRMKDNEQRRGFLVTVQYEPAAPASTRNWLAVINHERVS